jgi:AcrR family transcriptional regulator
LEKHYDSITVQEVLDRADVGRSTFYTHFQSMDELLISGTQELRKTLHAALENHRKSAKPRENVIAFSRAMFDHAYGYRNVYFALCLLRPLEHRSMADCSAAITGCSGGIDTTRMQGRNCEAEDSEFGRSRRFVCSLPYFGFLRSVEPPHPHFTPTRPCHWLASMVSWPIAPAFSLLTAV